MSLLKTINHIVDSPSLAPRWSSSVLVGPRRPATGSTARLLALSSTSRTWPAVSRAWPGHVATRANGLVPRHLAVRRGSGSTRTHQGQRSSQNLRRCGGWLGGLSCATLTRSGPCRRHSPPPFYETRGPQGHCALFHRGFPLRLGPQLGPRAAPRPPPGAMSWRSGA